MSPATPTPSPTPAPALTAQEKAAQDKRRRLWRWLVFGSLALAALVYSTYFMAEYWPVLPPEKIAQPSVTYSKAPPDSKFAISLEAPIDHPRDREVDVTLVLTNWDDAKTIQLLPLANGWPFEAGDCPSLKIARGQSKAALVVGPHSAVSYVVRLVADCAAEAQPISLNYKAMVGPNEVDGYILAAPLTLVGETRQTWGKVFTLLNGLLHLFIAPLTLLAIGWRLNEAVQERDKRQKAEQDERDEKQKKEQEARDRRGEVLNTLISNYRELVVSDYLPISRRMQTVESELPEEIRNAVSSTGVAPLAAAQIDGLFCAILLFRARLLHFFTMKGGIYFRSKQAELLFRDLMNGFFGAVREKLGKEEFRQLVEMIGPEDTLAAATEKYRSGWAAGGQQFLFGKANRDLYVETRAKFLDWVNTDRAGFRARTRLLQIATEVLSFECDRPFYQTAPNAAGEAAPDRNLTTAGWYFDPPLIELRPEMYAIPEDLKTDKPGSKGIYTGIREYLQNLPEECRKGVAVP